MHNVNFIKELISFCIWTFICIVKNFPFKHFIKLHLHFKTAFLILRKHSSFLKNLNFFEFKDLVFYFKTKFTEIQKNIHVYLLFEKLKKKIFIILKNLH